LTFDTIYVLCLFLYTAPTLSATQPLDPPQDRAAERFAMLRELADIGMEMARALQGEVRARAEAIDPDEPPKGVAELGLAFSRVSRAVRQTLALEARLEDDRLVRERAAEAAAEARSQSNNELSERAARVRAKLMQLIHPDRERDHQWDDVEWEDLNDEEEDERGEGFVADRPAADVVAGVCGDLGLEPDLSLWTDENSAAASTARGAGGVQFSAPEEHREAAAIESPHPDRERGRPP
jgi:hypothetical protein